MQIPGVPRPAFARGDDIAALVLANARAKPAAEALVEGSRTRTWEQLAGRIASVAGALRARGIGKGDRVAVLSKNSIEYVEFFFGALASGASVVPLPTMATPDALVLMLNDSDTAALGVSAEYREFADALVERRDRAMALWGLDFANERWHACESDASGPPNTPIAGEDEFDVMYSSGTTGVPKGIVHSHAVRKASYAGGRARYFDASTINIIATPFYSNTTCVTWFLTTAVGGRNVLMKKFDVGEFLRLVATHRVSHAMLVPVQYDRILAHEAFAQADTSSLRYLFSTSAPLSADTKRAIVDRLSADLIEIYGMTEGGVVTSLSARAHPDKLASVGRPGEDCELRIIDESGREVAPGMAGEVVGRAPNIMCGYLNRPRETEDSLWHSPDGRTFLRSGDIGRLDADGFLFLLDRKKDVIISGGFNVYASDLEAVLQTHPAVAEVAVIGVPSRAWGETPLACVVPRAGVSIEADELVAFCNARVGKNQRLSAVEFHHHLPRNSIGKILKNELRDAPRKTSAST